MTDAAISRELHIPRRTVSDFHQRLIRRRSAKNLPHPGRPRIISASQDQCIVCTAESDTRIPFTELHNITNMEASVSTVRLRLHEDHMWKWKALKRPQLTEEHAAERLKWARAHQNWGRSRVGNRSTNSRELTERRIENLGHHSTRS